MAGKKTRVIFYRRQCPRCDFPVSARTLRRVLEWIVEHEAICRLRSLHA